MTYSDEVARQILEYCIEHNLPLPGTPEEWEKIYEESEREHN